jgi:hypothetical protein
MNTVYTNNTEITTFLNRAQQKIASLSSIIVEHGGDSLNDLLLLLELSDFIESLDSCYCEWEEEDILRWIHEYNHRANLYSIPYIEFTGFVSILIGGSGLGLPITTHDISDYIIETNILIRATPHNELSGLQGGTIDERYHVTKQMYDYLDALLNVKVDSTVSLTVNTNTIGWPSGYYELGTTINGVDLLGAVQYNYYKQASYFEYKRNNLVVGARNSNPGKLEQPNHYVDNTPLSTDTTYSFNAQFPTGLKTATRSIYFKQPMYYGLIKHNEQTVAKAILGTKNVRDVGEMTIDFNIPVGNTLINNNAYLVPYIFIPFSWGRFSTAYSGIFDFATDWISTKVSMPLVNGTSVDGLLLVYPTQIEGLNTFKFNW